MTLPFLAILAASAFAVSWALTRLVEARSGALGLVQAPNERSSHSVPTPRGGGIGLAVAGILVCITLAMTSVGPFAALALLAGVVAILGFVDDLRDLSAGIRFGVQIVVLSLLIAIVPPMPGLALTHGVALGGWVLAVLLVLAGVWWINLFNFMDGIDGIIASQAILILLGAAAIWLARDGSALQAPLLCLMMALTAATLGFLPRNWPPARIFMGDVGSNFLAFMILAIALMSIAAGALSYAGWLILSSACLTDATVTLVRRAARGERPWKAHRRHAYQQLSRQWGHRPVTLLYAGISVCWSAPLAWAAMRYPGAEWLLALLAFLPVTGFVIWAGAGDRAERGRG